jgi:hypothetical protein
MATSHDPDDHNTYGILVGWTHSEFADKLDLRLQTTRAAGRLAHSDVENLHVVMTPQQAALLANYLFTITQQTPPKPPRRSLLARWFT